MSNDAPTVTVFRAESGARIYEVPGLGSVARVWHQGGWNVRLTVAPDEHVLRRTVTESGAESIALRHALSL